MTSKSSVFDSTSHANDGKEYAQSPHLSGALFRIYLKLVCCAKPLLFFLQRLIVFPNERLDLVRHSQEFLPLLAI
jgi:hypothetical protein